MSIETEDFHQLDSIVSKYLRDRDVQCPNCSYNLCGIERSSCPECACQLDLLLIDRTKPESEQRAIRLGILFLMLYCGIYVVANTASLITILVGGSVPTTLLSGMMYFGGQIFWMFTLLWTVRLWSRARKGMHTRIKHFRRPAIAILIMHLLGMFFHIYAAVLSLGSVI